MYLALSEAKKALGRTSPNPVVGVVIVKDDEIIATGYHKKAGESHAEQVALKAAGPAARDADLYVNLEPCCHQGRTEPCADALIRAGVRRVIAGVADPNPVVSGRGLTALKKAGVDVTHGVLEEECRRLNAPFFKFIQTQRPFVTAKYAMTLDGKTATVMGDSQWISNPQSRRRVHQLRNLTDAILVGTQTLLHDDPSLTTRGVVGGRDPIRVVLDPFGDIPADAKILANTSEAPTWIACGVEKHDALTKKVGHRAEVLPFELEHNGCIPIRLLLEELGRRKVMTLLVEGGGETLASFANANLLDKVFAFVAPRLIGGRAAPTPFGGRGTETMADGIPLKDVDVERIGDDVLITGTPTKCSPD